MVVDFTRLARITPVDGSPFLFFSDTPQKREFRVDGVDNHLKSLPDTPPSSQWNFGQFSQGDNWTAWGTGPTYQEYRYESRLDLVAGERMDAVMAQGFWSQAIEIRTPMDFIQPGAIWMLTDFMSDSSSYSRAPTWFTSLVSVEAITNVSEPPALAIAVLGLAVVSLRRRSSKRTSPSADALL